MKVFFYTPPCLTRQLEAISMKRLFSENGWEVVENHREADIILIGTCGVTKKTENRSIKSVMRYSKDKGPGAKVIVFGCLPIINKEKLESFFDGTTLDPNSINKISEIVGLRTNFKNFVGNEFKKNPYNKYIFRFNIWKGFFDDKLNENAFYITVSTGCLGKCSYCAIKNAIGKLKSRQIEDILKDFERGVGLGYKRFVLCASDMGAYGADINTDLTELLRNILAREGDYKLSITSFSPKWWKKLGKGMVEFVKSKKIDFISVSVQSGNNRILKMMNREYTVEDFEDCINHLKEANPDLTIRTHIMCGFPTETEKEFKDSMRLLKNQNLKCIVPTVYSERPGTAQFPEEFKIPETIKRSRMIRLYTRIYLNRIVCLPKTIFSSIKNVVSL